MSSNARNAGRSRDFLRNSSVKLRDSFADAGVSADRNQEPLDLHRGVAADAAVSVVLPAAQAQGGPVPRADLGEDLTFPHQRPCGLFRVHAAAGHQLLK